jgi:hypothetical protein
MDKEVCNFGAVGLQHCNYSSLLVYHGLPDILTKLKTERLFHKSPELLLFLIIGFSFRKLTFACPHLRLKNDQGMLSFGSNASSRLIALSPYKWKIQ